MSTQKNLRAIRKAIADAGGRLLSYQQGRHLKLRIDFGAGPRLVSCSVSPSDVYAVANVIRDIRRLKDEAGVQRLNTIGHGPERKDDETGNRRPA